MMHHSQGVQACVAATLYCAVLLAVPVRYNAVHGQAGANATAPLTCPTNATQLVPVEEVRGTCWGVPFLLCGRTTEYKDCAYDEYGPNCAHALDYQDLHAGMPCEYYSFPLCNIYTLGNRCAPVNPITDPLCRSIIPMDYEYLFIRVDPSYFTAPLFKNPAIITNPALTNETFSSSVHRLSSDTWVENYGAYYMEMQDWNYITITRDGAPPNTPAVVWSDNFGLAAYVQPKAPQPIDTPSLDTPSTVWDQQRWLFAPPSDFSWIPDGAAAIAISAANTSFAAYEVLNNGTFFCIAVITDIPDLLGRLVTSVENNRLTLITVARTISYGLCSGRRLYIFVERFGAWRSGEDDGFVGATSHISYQRRSVDQSQLAMTSEMWEGSCELSYEPGKFIVTADAYFNTSIAPTVTATSYRFKKENMEYSFFNNSAPPGLNVGLKDGILSGTISVPATSDNPIRVYVQGLIPHERRLCHEITVMDFTVSPPLLVSSINDNEELTIGTTFERKLEELLRVSGGTAPYNVSYIGELPTGIDFRGSGLQSAFGGIPTTKPSINPTPISFCVADSAGAKACDVVRFRVFDQLTIGGCVQSLTARHSTTIPPPTVEGGTGNYTYNLAAHNFTDFSFNATTGVLVVSVDEGGEYAPLLLIQDSSDARHVVRLRLDVAPPLFVDLLDFRSLELEGTGLSYESFLQTAERRATDAATTTHNDTRLPVVYGRVDSRVYLQFEHNVAGGLAPYVYSIDSSPDNSFNLARTSGTDVLQGTPSAVGNFTLRYTVRDDNGATFSQDLAFVVIEPAPVVPPAPSTENRRLALGVGVSIGLLCLLVLLFVFQRQRKLARKLKQQKQEQSEMSHKDKLIRTILARIPPRYRDKFVVLEQQKITLGKKLGNGFFGDVHQGMYVEETEVNHATIRRDRLVAVKKQRFTTENQQLAVADEVSILQSLRECPFVVYLQGIVVMDDEGELAWTVTELCAGGDLQHFVSALPKIDMEVAFHHLYQITCALEYIHARGIVHRDLALRNVFLLSTLESVKLGDFGLATSTTEYTVTDEPLAFPHCSSAPELLVTLIKKNASKQPVCESDVWSFGVVLWAYMVGGVAPARHLGVQFVENDTATLYKLITQNKQLFQIPGLPAEISRVLQRCFEPDYKNRISVTELQKAMSGFAMHYEGQSHDPYPALALATGSALRRTRTKPKTAQDDAPLPVAQQAKLSRVSLAHSMATSTDRRSSSVPATVGSTAFHHQQLDQPHSYTNGKDLDESVVSIDQLSYVNASVDGTATAPALMVTHSVDIDEVSADAAMNPAVNPTYVNTGLVASFINGAVQDFTGIDEPESVATVTYHASTTVPVTVDSSVV
eukprot:m.160757 g.160757  ORF g.160757 m.160757 type:complete len:1350 (+) comp14352_c0_seq21:268-4317(+)